MPLLWQALELEWQEFFAAASSVGGIALVDVVEAAEGFRIQYQHVLHMQEAAEKLRAKLAAEAANDDGGTSGDSSSDGGAGGGETLFSPRYARPRRACSSERVNYRELSVNRKMRRPRGPTLW